MFDIPVAYAAMFVGAVGALVPMWRAHGTDCRVRIGHGAMAVSMVAMMIPGVPTGIHLLGGAVLIALAVFVTGETMHRRTAIPCAVDLTAMGVLLLLAPTSAPAPAASAPGPGPGQAPSGHHHGGAGISTGWLPLVVLVCWALLTLHLFRSTPRRERRSGVKTAAAGSALMILGMAPMAV
ncbi:hypothetical protein CJ179_46230 [Rhodococcus sp. ACS1]|uniref:DUF5134 domain-containing protein n=1 Tax=Rhodococcus TaxID=1827 RepID=UPI000BB131F2|nr:MULTISPECIES: DUF5134 domain-containing protein [Rhodococcus]PBC36425.1 hypothetical protein CJ179_46230 [Rhodococcus sp. ACS1]QSE79310.1 DUF5134 domain-containing protein [Rhodococcus koreensis]